MQIYHYTLCPLSDYQPKLQGVAMCQHPLDDKNRRELNFNRSAINYQVNHRLKPRSIVCDYHSGRIGIWPPPEKKPREKAG